ncbi:MAG: M20/M25/M40 family metallo-hydrolase [Deltaproteobacteria bacterium]|nr:M20/M25/M40 family metallo-hydrolase [Deltaproteobacteria bacterium]
MPGSRGKAAAVPEPSRAIDHRRLHRILRRLLDIYSPYGKEEAAVDYLAGVFRRAGVACTLQEVDENRANLLVLPDHGDLELLLVGHLDTVPAYDLENYGYVERDALVYGLGAADMKGGCAALVEACLAMWAAGPPLPPVGLALVVGEEEEGDGARRLVEEYHAPWAIIGEPTDLMVCLTHYGYLESQVRARGIRRHASLARPGDNPVEAVLRLLLEVTGFLHQTHPEVVANIRDILSSPEGFVVPEMCEAWIDCHLPPDTALGLLTTELEELAAVRQAATPQLDLDLLFTTIHHGYELPAKGRLVEALEGAFHRLEMSWQPAAFRSHSDANLLWAAGIKPVLLGPGRLQEAHAPEEWVPWAQVETAARIYLETIADFTR